MSLTACAALVERADPDRFLATMAAPLDARARLWPLYACNVELSRAPWVSAEPLVAAMRLQWWVDTLEGMGQGARFPAHEVAGPVAELVAERGLPADLLAQIAEARRADLEPEPFADAEDFARYLDATAGNLMWLAALALGAPAGAEAVVRDYAFGAGLANYLRAVPELVGRGRSPLPAGVDAAALAREGLDRMARVRGRDLPRAARVALWPGWQAKAILQQAHSAPGRIMEGSLGPSEFARRGGLLFRAVTGRI